MSELILLCDTELSPGSSISNINQVIASCDNWILQDIEALIPSASVYSMDDVVEIWGLMLFVAVIAYVVRTTADAIYKPK